MGRINDYRELAQKLKPYIAPWIVAQGNSLVAAPAAGGLATHALNGAYHSGTLAQSQAPWAVTDDEFATHAADPDAHHAAATAGNGIIIAGQQVSLAASVAGAGLTHASGVLAVGAGTLISVAADSVGVAAGAAYQFIGTGGDTGAEWRNVSELAGNGLTAATGVLAVGVSGLGLGVGADAVTLASSSNPGAAAAILATSATGSLQLDTNLLYVDAPSNRVGINKTPNGAALDIEASATADHSQRIKQIASQTGRLWRIENTAGDELIVLDSAGNLQSGNPGFTSGLTGWQITPTGNAEFNNAWIRGELHASLFVVDEFHASGGTLFVATAGALENAWTLDTDTGTSAILDIRTTSGTGSGTQIDIRTTSGDGSGTQITARWIENYIDISDPASGHAMLFAAGDTLRCKAIGYVSGGIDVWDIWMTVSYVGDETDYYRYYVQIRSGGTDDLIIPAGTAIVSYGVRGDGRLLLTSDLNYAPYMDVFTRGGDAPWTGAAGEIVPHVRLGRLDGVGVPGLSGIEQYGIVAGTDLSDANEPYLYATNLGVKLYQVPLTLNDGNNDTVKLEAGGRVRMGTNVGTTATTGFDFDPVTGNLTIGSASYAGSVTVYGTIYLPGGTPVQTMTWRGAWSSGVSYAVQDAVSYNSKSWINDTAHTSSAGNAPGTGAMWDLLADQGATGATGSTGATGPTGPTGPAGADNQDFAFLEANTAAMAGKAAGAYMVAEYIGYWNGSAFAAYIDNAGNFRFGSGSGSAKLEYSASAGKLRGVNSAGTEQWYAQASTGKWYAGGGAVIADDNGIQIYRTTWADDDGTPEPTYGTNPNTVPNAYNAIAMYDTAASWVHTYPSDGGTWSYPSNQVVRLYASSKHLVPETEDWGFWAHYYDGVLEVPTPSMNSIGGSVTRRLWLKAPTIYLEGDVIMGTSNDVQVMGVRTTA